MSAPAQPRFGFKINEYGPGASRIFAESDSQYLLQFEIQQYITRRVAGRSCLIAGPRGAGKTTLVTAALERFASSPTTRSLPVRIHGPSLVGFPKPQKGEESDAERSLRFLIIGLYQSAADMFAEAYRWLAVRTQDESLIELAAQLRVTLDGAPPLSTLRFMWERLHALSSGVLFGGDMSTRPSDQGYRELIALSTAAEAYRSCTGEFQKEQTDERTSAQQRELKLQATARTEEFTRALLSLLSGGAVAGAVQTAGAHPVLSAFAGVATTLASMASLTYSSSRSAGVTLKEQVKFLPKLDVSSLVHRTPVLIQRFLEAGLAPVFVIDELDKVRNLSKPLNDLVSQLKFICADQAFFCFLTDRAYLVETARIAREQFNSVQQTVFTDRLFVMYNTGAFHRFLDRVIRVEAPGAPDTVRQSLERDREAIRYILVQRSRMLIFNLVSQLRDLRESSDWLKFAPQEPVSKLIYRFNIMMQLAIEVVLLEPAIAERVQNDANFGQIIYDALYHPARVWFQGKEEVDISPDALMESIGDLGEQFLVIEENDFESLYGAVRRLLGLIANPKRLKNEAIRQQQALGVSSDLCEVIPLQPLLLVPSTNDGQVIEDHFRWRYDCFGAQFQKAKVNEILTEDLTNSENFIDRMQRILGLVPLEVSDLLTPRFERAEWFIDLFAGDLLRSAVPQPPLH